MNDSEQHSRPEVTVFLPCHSLEDLSEWMENDEASAILNAWTVAWHPFVICESEGLPSWASVDLPWTREGKSRHLARGGQEGLRVEKCACSGEGAGHCLFLRGSYLTACA